MDALALYRTMVRIRRFEERVEQLFLAGKLPGFVHLSIGQEAVPAGVCAHLRSDDYVTSTHRGHGHAIAKGVDVGAMMAELYGKRTGSCRGKGGSMHIFDYGKGMLGPTGSWVRGSPSPRGRLWRSGCWARNAWRWPSWATGPCPGGRSTKP